MKYIMSFLGVGLIVVAILFCGGWNKKQSANQDYLRIHIVANSNSSFDQNLKYLVKDAVVEYLTSKLENAEDAVAAKAIVTNNAAQLEAVANAVLLQSGAAYTCKITLTEEDMPTRAYGNLTLEGGVYPSLKITLGQGKGDNWWCVVFPAVCFIDSKNIENFEYISKIWDMINGVTN